MLVHKEKMATGLLIALCSRGMYGFLKTVPLPRLLWYTPWSRELFLHFYLPLLMLKFNSTQNQFREIGIIFYIKRWIQYCQRRTKSFQPSVQPRRPR